MVAINSCPQRNLFLGQSEFVPAPTDRLCEERGKFFLKRGGFSHGSKIAG